MNFLIYEKNFVFFFSSVTSAEQVFYLFCTRSELLYVVLFLFSIVTGHVLKLHVLS
jgi:hypothetical protein